MAFCSSQPTESHWEDKCVWAGLITKLSRRTVYERSFWNVALFNWIIWWTQTFYVTILGGLFFPFSVPFSPFSIPSIFKPWDVLFYHSWGWLRQSSNTKRIALTFALLWVILLFVYSIILLWNFFAVPSEIIFCTFAEK